MRVNNKKIATVAIGTMWCFVAAQIFVVGVSLVKKGFDK